MQPPETPDADYIEEQIANIDPASAIDTAKKAPTTAAEMMSAITEMKANGQISTTQARELRGELGVKQSSFTKHQTSTADKKKNRKAQKAARRTGGRGRG
jgi:hypothetical protein